MKKKISKKLRRGYNDLATLYPELAKEWHPEKNGTLKSSDVTVVSRKKVWWFLSYDDPETGKHFDFEWQASVSNRTKGMRCPYLSGRRVWKGFNDLATLCPELATEWHPTKNGDLTPSDVTVNSNRNVWWRLIYIDSGTGERFEFEWESRIYNRTKGKGCPYLSGRRVWKGFNDLATLRPELAMEWHPNKNGELTPSDVTENSNREVWWICSCGHEWLATISSRTLGGGCPMK